MVTAKGREPLVGAQPGGDTGAPDFERVYDEHFDFVWRSLRRMGVHRSALDDAVQDVFVVVLRRLDEFEGRSTLKTWIFGIALRVARNYGRSAARHSTTTPLPDDLAVPTDQRPDHHAEKHQALALVEAFIETLDEDKRTVFVLAELEECTAPEIAAALGVRLNTVYSRLRAARKQFESAVKRHRAGEERVSP